MKYREIDIEINQSGTFIAQMNGERLTAKTLKSLQAQIDKREPFKPFTAITLDDYEIEEIEIIGVRQVSRSYQREQVWVTRYGGERRQIIRDTPENRQRLAHLGDMRKANQEAKDKMDAEENELEESIATERAPTY